jgi:hypothetical protein
LGCITGERAFVIHPQSQLASGENSFAYDDFASGATVYAYVLGNPLGFVDPLGLWTLQVGIGGSFSVPNFVPGGLSLVYGAGLIIDGSGTVSGYDYFGGGAYAGTPGFEDGIQVGVTDAKCSSQLSGWSPYSSLAVGVGPAFSIDGTSSLQDPISGPEHYQGSGVTIGVGAGFSYSLGGSYTTITSPIAKLW